MNIKTKLLLSIGLLTGMIILLVSLSVIYLQNADGCRTRQPDSFDRLKTSRCMGGNYRRHLHSLRCHISYLASSIDK